MMTGVQNLGVDFFPTRREPWPVLLRLCTLGCLSRLATTRLKNAGVPVEGLIAHV